MFGNNQEEFQWEDLMADETTIKDIFETRTGSFNISNFRNKIKGEAFASKFYFKFSDPDWEMFKEKRDLIEDLIFYSEEGFQIPARRIEKNNEKNCDHRSISRNRIIFSN